MSRMPRAVLVCVCHLSVTLTGAAQPVLDKSGAARGSTQTLKKMSLEQIVGQMIFAPFQSTYLSSDTDDLRAARQAGARDADRRRDRVRRQRSDPAGDAQQHLRRGRARPAAGAGVDPESPAVDLDAAAADLIGLRMGRADAHRRRDQVPARDGVWRHRRSAARL